MVVKAENEQEWPAIVWGRQVGTGYWEKDWWERGRKPGCVKYIRADTVEKYKGIKPCGKTEAVAKEKKLRMAAVRSQHLMRERLVQIMRYGCKPMTYKQIARRLGIKTGRASQIIYHVRIKKKWNRAHRVIDD